MWIAKIKKRKVHEAILIHLRLGKADKRISSNTVCKIWLKDSSNTRLWINTNDQQRDRLFIFPRALYSVSFVNNNTSSIEQWL